MDALDRPPEALESTVQPRGQVMLQINGIAQQSCGSSSMCLVVIAAAAAAGGIAREEVLLWSLCSS